MDQAPALIRASFVASALTLLLGCARDGSAPRAESPPAPSAIAVAPTASSASASGADAAPAAPSARAPTQDFTTKDLLDREIADIAPFAPALITLAIGANDLVHGSSTASYRAQVRRIFAAIVSARVPMINVVALPQPDWSVAPAARSFGDRSVVAQRIEAFNVEINLDKRGRRFFEQASGDDEIAQIELALGKPEHASPHHVRRLRDELAARAAHVIDTRRLALLELLEVLGRTFGPASMKAYLDADDYIPPLATMAYYRDEAAVCADLALLADATVALSEPGRPGSYLGYALTRYATIREAKPMDAPSVAEVITRLRTITPREVRVTADAMPSWVTTLAGGLFVSNPDLDPVGASIAPFFERLLSS